MLTLKVDAHHQTTNPNQTNLWVTTGEAARILGVSVWTLYRATRAGTLCVRSMRVGSALRYFLPDLAPIADPQEIKEKEQTATA